jgi:hypothetical protein
MNTDKRKKFKKPDLRRMEGSVLVKDTNENLRENLPVLSPVPRR